MIENKIEKNENFLFLMHRYIEHLDKTMDMHGNLMTFLLS